MKNRSSDTLVGGSHLRMTFTMEFSIINFQSAILCPRNSTFHLADEHFSILWQHSFSHSTWRTYHKCWGCSLRIVLYTTILSKYMTMKRLKKGWKTLFIRVQNMAGALVHCKKTDNRWREITVIKRGEWQTILLSSMSLSLIHDGNLSVMNLWSFFTVIHLSHNILM